jgi:hypothetical protein
MSAEAMMTATANDGAGTHTPYIPLVEDVLLGNLGLRNSAYSFSVIFYS